MSDHRFLDLADFLAPPDLVVVNETKVRAARLRGRRQGTGGAVELLLIEQRDHGVWEALARPSRRLRPGVVIEFDGLSASIESKPIAGRVEVTLDTTDPEGSIDRVGEIPLPPYFTGLLADPDRYQTMFARAPGSAAAPTAGLHFTRAVTSRLKEKDIQIVPIDLHVSLDTFRPMTVDRLEDHEMHSEWCSVPVHTANAIEQTRRGGGRVVAIGTTVVRALESMANGAGGVTSGAMRTTLFLKPGSEFRVVDALVTNFHVPGSTLLALLAGFMGSGWRDAYDTALRRGYRFLSFGDAMFAVKDPS